MRRCSCCSRATSASPPRGSMAEIAQAQLLSNGGEADQSLARIDDALARFPGHPDLLYQKAILLEKAGRTDAAIAQLESLYRDRPQDGAIANALGLPAGRSQSRAVARGPADQRRRSRANRTIRPSSTAWAGWTIGAAIRATALPLLERAFRLAQDGDIGAHWGEVLWALRRQGQGARGLESRADRRS